MTHTQQYAPVARAKAALVVEKMADAMLDLQDADEIGLTLRGFTLDQINTYGTRARDIANKRAARQVA